MTARAVMAVAVAVAACKEAGTIAIEVDLPDDGTCAAGAEVIVYAIPGAVCGEVACSKYVDACDDGCVVACADGCPLEELSAALALTPPPGRYALVIDYYDAGGTPVATACAQLTVDADGTDDVELIADGVCCTSSP